jgi:hypothetical protein
MTFLNVPSGEQFSAMTASGSDSTEDKETVLLNLSEPVNVILLAPLFGLVRFNRALSETPVTFRLELVPVIMFI